MQTNRRFNNELMAFKQGEDVQHDEPQAIQIKGVEKKSVIKLVLILVILTVAGYVLIKIPLMKKGVIGGLKVIENTSQNVELYRQAVLSIYPEWSDQQTHIQQLFDSGIDVETVEFAVLTWGKQDFSVSLLQELQHVYVATNTTETISWVKTIAWNELVQLENQGIKLESIVELNNHGLFSRFSKDEILQLAQLDSSQKLKRFDETVYTQSFSFENWKTLVKNHIQPEMVNELAQLETIRLDLISIDDLVGFQKAQTDLSELITAIKMNEIASFKEKEFKKIYLSNEQN